MRKVSRNKVGNLFEDIHKLKKIIGEVEPVPLSFLVVALVIVALFVQTRGSVPYNAELSFIERSAMEGTFGSVVPASCESNVWNGPSVGHDGYVSSNHELFGGCSTITCWDGSLSIPAAGMGCPAFEAPTLTANSASYPRGTYNFTVPVGVTSVTATIIGGGGGGGGAVFANDYHAGNAGGAGGFITQTIAVTPGQSMPVSVGVGGCGGFYWMRGTAQGGFCTSSPTTWAGGTGGDSTFGGLTATGGGGGSVGGGSWHPAYGFLDGWVTSWGAPGTPYTDYTTARGKAGWTWWCNTSGEGGAGGTNGSAYGAGGYGGGCNAWGASYGQSGQAGRVLLSWSAPTPVITSVAINSPTVVANGVNQYTITLIGNDTFFGGNAISEGYTLVNWQGANSSGAPHPNTRGYPVWSLANNFIWIGGASTLVPASSRACTGGGTAGIYNGLGAGYINLVSCSTSVAGNTRTISFVVTFNSSFTTPVTGNVISAFLGNGGSGSYDGWDFAFANNTFDITTTNLLTVTKAGTGAGTVTSTPSGISCGADCTEAYNNGTSVTLTATPTSGSGFTGWSGACSGVGSCTVSMTALRSVTATFVAYSCQGSTPANALLCASDSTGLSADTSRTLVNSCGVPKCEYYCDATSNYILSGGVCIKTQCANGIDDDGDFAIDRQAGNEDPGCPAFGIDNNESDEPVTALILATDRRIVTMGDRVQLTYDLGGRVGCILTGPGINQSGLTVNGSVQSPPIEARSTYTLNCAGTTDPVTVEIVPRGFES